MEAKQYIIDEHGNKIEIRVNKFRKNNLCVSKELEKIHNKITGKPNEITGVYAIHSKVNDFIYSGSAGSNFAKRWNEHKRDLKNLKHTNVLLQYLFCEYGIKNLQFYIIEVCDKKEVLKRESYYVHHFIPEININALLGTTGCTVEVDRGLKKWYQTEEGQIYRKNTIIKKRQKWIKTSVGRNTARTDLINLREKLNKNGKNIDTKLNELIDYCRAYYPDIVYDRETLVKFLDKGVLFKPFWTKYMINKYNAEDIIQEQIKKENEQIAEVEELFKKEENDIKNLQGCFVFFIIIILLFLLVIFSSM